MVRKQGGNITVTDYFYESFGFRPLFFQDSSILGSCVSVSIRQSKFVYHISQNNIGIFPYHRGAAFSFVHNCLRGKRCLAVDRQQMLEHLPSIIALEVRFFDFFNHFSKHFISVQRMSDGM